jgi:hypothetical protein
VVCRLFVPKVLCVLVDSICIKTFQQIFSHEILTMLNKSSLYTPIQPHLITVKLIKHESQVGAFKRSYSLCHCLLKILVE